MRTGSTTVGLVLLAAFAVALPGPGRADATPRPAAAVAVGMFDFRFRVAPASVRVGTVRFTLTNRGAAAHDFRIAGRRSRVLRRGQRQTVVVRFAKPGRYAFLCTLPGHARLGMKGTLVVRDARGAPPPPAPPPPPPAPPPPPDPAGTVRAVEIGRFDRPVFVTAAPGDPSRLYVVQQGGRIRVLRDGVLLPEPFLDLEPQVIAGVETGLLSLAFAPGYPADPRLYVYYNARDSGGAVNVAEYRRSALTADQADPFTRRLVLEIPKPWENHNGGMMQFGRDGLLYVSVGDGDSGVLNKPGAFAQRRDDLLGNILRIDPLGGDPYAVPDTNPFVGQPDVRPEVWAYGLRNPWRFWLDPATGELYVADVALAGPEEIDWLPYGADGRNFGWPCFEGTRPFDATESCPGAVTPVLEYLVPNKCSVIGGLVARDPRLPALEGRFLYTDFCLGALRSLRVAGGAVSGDGPLGVTVASPTSFGQDALGRVYVTSLDGPVYRLDPASGP
jgi:glucose/arabinose dehydrogenase